MAPSVGVKGERIELAKMHCLSDGTSGKQVLYIHEIGNVVLKSLQYMWIEKAYLGMWIFFHIPKRRYFY